MQFGDKRLRCKYSEILDRFAGLPDYNRTRAENRFLLLREFEDYFEVEEKERLGKKYKVHPARRRFCEKKGVSLNTFLNYRRLEKKYGITGLIPHYGGPYRYENEKIIFPINDHGYTKKQRDRCITAIIKLSPLNPLACIRDIKKIVEIQQDIPDIIKQTSLAPFNFILSFSKPHYFKPQDLPLTKDEIKKLKRYKAQMHKNHWARAVGLLMAHRGNSVFDIAIAVGRSPGTIYSWFRLYKKYGLDFIETKSAEDQRKKMWETRATRVIDILHTPPKTFNINRASWTYDAIIQAYHSLYAENLPKTALKRVIRETKYTWRHARLVLTSPDPKYKEKVNRVLTTLRNTKKNEAFFFVDELGPYRIKKYGGQALVSKETTYTIPSIQKSKGKVQAIAALEAFTNQLTWKFIDYKDAGAVIALLDMLRDEYKEKTKLFITWDTIATHHAHSIQEWIEKNNKEVSTRGQGPYFKVIPLPSKAQFLNVIESVFGGMKKAVIHNSDYSSKMEMEKAIHRHFEERNIYFRKNPRRVGHKIWDDEAFDVDKLQGGLFKKM